MKKLILFILCLLLSSTKCSLEDCQAIAALSCEKLESESEIADIYDK